MSDDNKQLLRFFIGLFGGIIIGIVFGLTFQEQKRNGAAAQACYPTTYNSVFSRDDKYFTTCGNDKVIQIHWEN